MTNEITKIVITKFATDQGDQMLLRKICPKFSPIHFLSKSMHNLNCGKEYVGYFCYFYKKTAQSKQLPNGPKFVALPSI
jgi:hypothetical protein